MTTHTWAQASAWAHNLSVLETSGHTQARQSKQDKRSWGSSGVLNLGVNGRKMPTTSLRTLRPMIWVVFIYLYPLRSSLESSLQSRYDTPSRELEIPIRVSRNVPIRTLYPTTRPSNHESSSYHVWGPVRHRYDLRFTNHDTLIRRY